MTTPPMSDKQLLDYSSEHLMHELSMLWELAELIPQKKPGTETSALVESYGIHLRNLIDFFYVKGRGDDVTARDFFDANTPWSPSQTPSLTTAHRRASKELSHLTQARMSGSPPEKGWDTRGLLREVGTVAREFGAKASSKKLHPKVKEFLLLPVEKMQVWIANNVTHCNVATQDASSPTVAFPLSGGSTQTQIISRVDITKPLS